jgi:hypothetical protein
MRRDNADGYDTGLDQAYLYDIYTHLDTVRQDHIGLDHTMEMLLVWQGQKKSMKTFADALDAHYQLPVTTVATGWLVERRDGSIWGWTDHDESVTIEGVLFRVGLGLTPTATHTSKDFAIDTLDVTIFMDVSTEREIVAGIWDGAVLTIFEYNWAAPPLVIDGEANILRYGELGHVKRANNVCTAEIRGLTQRLMRRVGRA